MALSFQKAVGHLLLCAIVVGRIDFGNSALSDYTTICSLKDPELNECIRKSTTQMLPHVFRGIPEMGIPPIYPFYMPQMHFQEPRYKMVLNFANSTLYGFNNLNLTKVRYNPNNYTLNLEYFLPQESFYSLYQLSGRISMLPITGKGNSTIIMRDVHVNMTVTSEPEIRDGVKYLKMKDFKSNYAPTSLHISFENLFNGNKILGNAVNKMLNNNWRDMLHFVGPEVQQIHAKMLGGVVDNLFAKVPYNQLFNDAD